MLVKWVSQSCQQSQNSPAPAPVLITLTTEPGEVTRGARKPREASSTFVGLAPHKELHRVLVDYALCRRFQIPMAPKPAPSSNNEVGSGTDTWEIVWLMAEIET